MTGDWASSRSATRSPTAAESSNGGWLCSRGRCGWRAVSGSRSRATRSTGQRCATSCRLADPGVLGALAGRRAVSGRVACTSASTTFARSTGTRSGLRAIVPDGFGVLAGPVRPGADHDRAARSRTPPGRHQGGRPRRGDPSGGGGAGGRWWSTCGLVGRAKSRDDRPCPCHGIRADRHRPARAGRAGTRRDAGPVAPASLISYWPSRWQRLRGDWTYAYRHFKVSAGSGALLVWLALTGRRGAGAS